MYSFFDLVGFECKKILKRKGSLIILILVALISIFTPVLTLVGNYYIDDEVFERNYEGIIKDREYARALSGRPIDEVLLSEMRDAYLKVPQIDGYSMTPEYQQYARPYSEIYWIAHRVYNFNRNSLVDLSFEEMQNFYQLRKNSFIGMINSENMSEKSKEKMIQLYNEIETPFVFSYTEGFDTLNMQIFNIGIFSAFAIAVCLAPMFAGEYSANTDQLILSAKLGKNKIIRAKIFTAIFLCIVPCLLFFACSFVMCGILFGFDGADTSFQLFEYVVSPYSFPMIQATAIYSMCVIFALLLTGAITLLLSSIFKTPFGVITIMSVLIFVPLILDVSSDKKLLYHIYNLLITKMMIPRTVFSYIPYEIFGLPILPYIFIPIFCTIVFVIALPFTHRAFANHQVG